MTLPFSQTIRVELGSRSYDVKVGTNLLSSVGAEAKLLFSNLKKVVVVTDSNVGPLYSKEVLGSFSGTGISCELITVPAGEASKAMSRAQEVCSGFTRVGLDRKSLVIALGGGVIGDLAGYCAAIYQRGIPYVQIPTTVLSQVDSSVGGKTGVNLPEAKNMVGCFHQPSLVIADVGTLTSLPKNEWNEGFAEIIKHAAIRDADMFDEIRKVANREGDIGALIARNIAIKARIVEADEHETNGLRALLNFGHTLGHAIENAAGYGRLLHGEAISLGLVAAARLSALLSGLSAGSVDRITSLLKLFHLPTELPDDLSEAEILSAMRHDKKFEAGRIRFVLLRAAGDAFVSDAVTLDHLTQAVRGLRNP
jgi:3-dehydroquinate synthase